MTFFLKDEANLNDSLEAEKEMHDYYDQDWLLVGNAFKKHQIDHFSLENN